MEHVKVTDDWLYKYMPVVDAAIIQELESQVDKEHKFSHKFERKMESLMRREAHQMMGGAWNVIKRAAIFLVGVIGAIFIFTMSVEANRKKFFETIKTFFEGSFSLTYSTDMDNSKLIEREPSYIPDKYKEINRTENENYLSIVYENNKGELLVWDQMLVTDGGSMTFDLEYDREETIQIQGNEAKVYFYGNNYKYVYYEYGEYAYLIFTVSLNTDEICRMLESIF